MFKETYLSVEIMTIDVKIVDLQHVKIKDTESVRKHVSSVHVIRKEVLTIGHATLEAEKMQTFLRDLYLHYKVASKCIQMS